MNLVESASNSSGSPLVMGLAIVGILLGGAGLYAGLSGRSGERGQEDRLAELEQRVERIGGAVEELTGQIRGLHHNTRTALQGINEQIKQMRQEMGSLRVAPAATTAPAANQPAPAAVAPAPSSAAAPAATKTYTIRAGDMVGKIARDHGTTVDAILMANPGLNPNRIKVGQVINLP